MDSTEQELRQYAAQGIDGADSVLADYIAKQRPVRRAPRVELDQAVITIGPPKCGKTTIVRALVKTHLTKYPNGIALIHDVNHQFKDLCRMYRTVGEWRVARERAAQAGEPFARGAAFHGWGESKAVAELAMELGDRFNTSDNVTCPIFLGYDETSTMEESSSTYIGPIDLQVATTRRHKGIAPAYNTQRQAALMQAFFEAATDVFVFRQSSDKSIRAIEIKLGLNKGALQQLASFDNFRYVHWQAGRGLV